MKIQMTKKSDTHTIHTVKHKLEHCIDDYIAMMHLIFLLTSSQYIYDIYI